MQREAPITQPNRITKLTHEGGITYTKTLPDGNKESATFSLSGYYGFRTPANRIKLPNHLSPEMALELFKSLENEYRQQNQQ